MTLSKEEKRKKNQQIHQGNNDNIQQRFGEVVDIHPSLPMVTVRFLHSENYVANKAWIPIAHSTLDIAHRFGALRAGLKVLVNTPSGNDTGAVATIIGNENENLGYEEQTENDVQTGAYQLFTPGSVPI